MCVILQNGGRWTFTTMTMLFMATFILRTTTLIRALSLNQHPSNKHKICPRTNNNHIQDDIYLNQDDVTTATDINMNANINRRAALQKAFVTTTSISFATTLSSSITLPVKVNAASTTSSTSSTSSTATSEYKYKYEYKYIANPGPLLRLPSYSSSQSSPAAFIPSVGYSLYKTDPAQAPRGVALALAAGVRHFDVATLYQSNAQVGDLLHSYIQSGTIPNATDTQSMNINIPNTPQKRRNELFISHKISNAEQSTSLSQVQQSIQTQMKLLQVNYLDLCSIHSPLTSKSQRLATYQAMLELQSKGSIRNIGLCNYGVGPLQEIVDAGLPPPSVIQLELSPFNQHLDVIQWAKQYGCVISCAAWSKLSSVSGPQEGWTTVAAIAKEKNVTKQQILIRWALHKGYVSLPRSGTGSKLERNAIAENSFVGCDSGSGLTLTREEMERLDALEEGLKAGRLGRRDGWSDDDVKGETWDPTLEV